MEAKIKNVVGAAVIAGLVSVAGGAVAAPITCNVADASANGSVANQCAGDDAVGANPAAETGFVNASFGGDIFVFVDKTKGAPAVAGFELTVTPGDDSPFKFFYTLSVPNDSIGATVDWVLGIKQASDSFVAYLFEDVLLTAQGIQGGFNSFWTNPSGGRTVNDFSHASGWIREGGAPPAELPEPGALLLLGGGLLGFVALRRIRSLI